MNRLKFILNEELKNVGELRNEFAHWECEPAEFEFNKDMVLYKRNEALHKEKLARIALKVQKIIIKSDLVIDALREENLNSSIYENILKTIKVRYSEDLFKKFKEQEAYPDYDDGIHDPRFFSIFEVYYYMLDELNNLMSDYGLPFNDAFYRLSAKFVFDQRQAENEIEMSDYTLAHFSENDDDLSIPSIRVTNVGHV